MRIALKKMLILFFVFLFLPENSHSQNYWTAISSPTSNTLTNCSFINSYTGWLSGESGTIVHTTTGGTNWIIQNSGTLNNIEDIFFLNEKFGWALSYETSPDSLHFYGTLLLRTTNGGNTWTSSMFPDTNMFMKSICYLDSLRGFLGGISASIVFTTNGGVNWTYTDTDSSIMLGLPVYKIRFYNNNLGYACGGFRDIAGITWVTTNGGLNWRGAVLAPEPFFDLTILNNQLTICAGGDLEYGSSIARTSNQGLNWFYDTLGVFGLATGIDNRTESEIWMATSYAEKFLYSGNSGITWTSISTPGNSAILDLDFTDSVTGFACGYNGIILKYDRTIINVFNSNNENFKQSFDLQQNYPNPFNPKTIINYQISMFNQIMLKVFDVLGNTIATLVNGNQKPGNYSVEFNAENLPSGIYYYTLKSGINFVTKKMVVIK